MRAQLGKIPHDWQAISSISIVHFVSHIHILTMAPLFPMLRDSFGVNYATLGLLTVGYNLMTVLLQPPMGQMVDRLGAMRVLRGGQILAALAFAGAMLAPGFWALAVFVMIAGAANAVYHPANMSILSSRVSETRRSTAFAIHSVAGTAGFAAAPALIGGCGLLFGWQAGFAAAAITSLCGLASTAFVPAPRTATHAAPPKAKPGKRDRRIWAEPRYLSQFVVFVFFGAISAALQGFLIPTLTTNGGLTTAQATAQLSAYLLMNTVGVLLGGLLARRIAPHRLFVGGMAMAAVIWGAASFGAPPPWAFLAIICAAGIGNGIALPARDTLLADQAQGPRQGAIFGFVTGGLFVGQLGAPLVVGPLVDHGYAMLMFPTIAVLSGLCLLGGFADMPRKRHAERTAP